jgi:hypothetical protein
MDSGFLFGGMMYISDEDADELLYALCKNGFSAPFVARIADHGLEGIAAADALAHEANRNAVRKAMESTKVWNRYRIY